MISDRVKKLRKQSLDAVPYISMERAQIVDRVYKEYEGSVSTPVLRALVLREIMKEKKLCINDGELIVGERGDAPVSTYTFPELCCHTVEDMETMDRREKIFFKVDDEAKKIQRDQIIPYWEKRSIRYHILKNMSEEWKAAYGAGIFTEFMEQRGPGHAVADGKIYEKGFLEFKAEIEASIKSLDFHTDDEALDKRDQLEAMKLACDAVMILGERYSQYASDLSRIEKDPIRKEELDEIAKICSHVPKYPPRTFREALQMYWFVHLSVITELNPWDSYSPGRLDQHLNPFYQREIAESSLTREDAEELLQCFWIKFNNQPAPPKVGVTLKESGTYTDFANIGSGGLTREGEDGVNDVSYLILDVIDKMKLLQPSSHLQVSHKTPDDFLKRGLKIVRKGWGQPSIFNTDTVIDEMVLAGKTLEDARDGGNSGCIETGAFGKEAFILTGYFNLPKILELTLNNGYDPISKKQIGIKTGNPRDFKSYQELFEAFKKQMKHFIDIKVEGNRIIERIYASKMPVPFMSVITDDCIKKGRDYNAGGARYNTSYIQGVGIGNITDALAAISYNVFDEKKFSMHQLLEATENNFEGYEEIHHLISKKTPKYGNDHTYADEIMVQIFESYRDEVTGRPNGKGGEHRINMLPTTCHVYFGSVLGATADGRLKNKPLADGISPSKGADRVGPTGVVKSASKMDHRTTGGTLLNQKFTPSVVKGEDGLNNLASLVRSYFKLGGHHIQFNIINRDTLIEAQERPKENENLIVRVAGYSDYFGNLDKALQDEIIERTEQDF